MSATQYDEIIGATSSQIRKMGYLRKLKAWSSQSFGVWSLKNFVVDRLRCQPYGCRCSQRRILLRFLCPLESEQTMKKKFFVLRAESANQPACLEYYENEKKWKSGGQPKRCIVLKTCFNINRKLDVKQKHALALYTKDDCFTMILENEEELESWLNSLLALQRGDDEDIANDQPPKPTFEHVWQVNVRNRGLANSKNIVGAYHLCLTSQSLSLVKLNTTTPQQIEFPLMSIRRCGHSYCFFFMELGRSAVTGSGELWMQTEDIVIAQNMHETILNAMRSSCKDEVAPRQRTRSSSINESSKSGNVHTRRMGTVVAPTVGIATSPTKRERSDSVPSRPRTISDGPLTTGRKSQPWNFEMQRPHSMYAHPSSYSPSDDAISPSPISVRRAADSGGSSVSIDEHDAINQFDVGSHKHWLSSPDNSNVYKSSITEENVCEDYLPMSPSDNTCKIEENCSSVQVVATKRRSQTSNSSSIKATSPGQKNLPDYMDMTPSITNSPSDSEGYMAMSPVGSFLADTTSVKSVTPVKSYLSSPVGSHTRNANDATNGYVPMAPLSSSSKSVTPDADGYLDMKPTNQEISKSSSNDAYLDMSLNTTPIKSGTPAEDIRFSEFQLDKVRTYFTADEEDDKLVRAYSVGSKPQVTRGAQLTDDDSASRVRAFSVGSKVGMQFRKKSSPTLDIRANCNNMKSSSAPLLSNSTSMSTGLSKNQNEDLMELDFAKGSNRAASSVKTCADSHSKGGFRSRSSLRLSTGRSTKSDLLQVIGEISHPSLEAGSKKSVTENNYSEMCRRNSNTEHVPQSISGEYVNIDLEKVRSASHKTSFTKPEPHEYANLQAGRLIPSPANETVAKGSAILTSVSAAQTCPARERVDDTISSSSLIRCSLSESPYENINFGRSPSRPSSISSDKELNYASLDLGSTVAITKDVDDDKVSPPHSPLSIKTSNDEYDKERLSYARIDFTKSEGLRNTSHTIRKIRQKTT